MDDPLVRYSVSDGVATVTLDSPHNRNALSSRLVRELGEALDAAAADPDARVLMITGAGPVFSSGADLKEQRSGVGANRPSMLAALPSVFEKIWSCPQPVVCRLNGLARAGGVGLMAACDLVVAPAAVTFSFTEVRIGVVPAIITVPVLRRMRSQDVHRLFLTGATVDASEASRLGLVDEVAAEGELDAVAARVVEQLMRGGPQALAITKQLTRMAKAMPEDALFAELERISADRFASAEGQEGMSAFAEKRDPTWIPAAFRRS